MVYREVVLQLGKWYEQVSAVRNQYTQVHGLPSRNGKLLNWEDAKIIGEQE